jgi:hypothetical protein
MEAASGAAATGAAIAEVNRTGWNRVNAQANAYTTVTVPVVILAGRLTTVHLEGSPSWPDSAALLQNPLETLM